MFGLLVIFAQRWGEPWYGKNTGLMEGLPTGLRYVELTGCPFLSVPGPVAAQRHTPATINVSNEPQRACRRHDQTQRVGADDALPLATLVLPQPGEGVTVTDSNFHSPAVAILTHDLVSAQRQIGGEKCCDGWGWLSLALLFGGGFALTSQHHDPHEATRQHRVPQATPGLDLGARFARVGPPSPRGLRQGFGRADQRAFFAGGTATLGGGGGRQLIELGAKRMTRCLFHKYTASSCGLASFPRKRESRRRAPWGLDARLRGHDVVLAPDLRNRHLAVVPSPAWRHTSDVRQGTHRTMCGNCRGTRDGDRK
jgi:hypothetical protein